MPKVRGESPGQEDRTGYAFPGLYRVPLLLHRYPREIPVPALGPVGRTDQRVVSVLRLRVVPTEEAQRDIRAERSSVEAELASIKAEGDPRLAVLRQEAQAIAELEESLVSRSTRLWNAMVGFVVNGRTRTECREHSGRLQKDLSWLGFRLMDQEFRVAPLLAALGPNAPLPVPLTHPQTDDSLAALLPLWEDRLDETEGILLGLHAMEGSPLFWQRFSHTSHSSAIFGQTGSGKTYASALGWMRLRYRFPDLSVFVLDPLGGLCNVVRTLGGTVYRAGTEEVTINPLDPATTGGDRRTKTSTVLTQFRALFPSISDEELAIVDTTLTSLYEGRPAGEPPLLEDLYDALEQESRTPARLLLLLRPAIEGSLRHLNFPTQVDLNGRLLGFDLSDITPGEMPFYLTLLLDYVYGEIRRRDGLKLLVVDEAHYLSRTPRIACFLDYLVRHVRHFGAGLELLSQNPEDFLGSQESRSVLLNLDSILMLRLRDGGEGVASLLGLTDAECDWLRRTSLPSDAGFSEGIFRTGSLHLPVALVSTKEEHRTLLRAFSEERNRGGARSTSGM